MKSTLSIVLLFSMCAAAIAQVSPLPPNWSLSSPQTSSGKLTPRPKTSANTARGVFDAQDYMKCDGVTDDTVGFQNAVNAAALGTLLLPKGVCIISATVAITSNINLQGAGDGADSSHAGTTLQWAGASATTPLLDLQGIRDSTFSDFLIQAGSVHPLAVGIQSTTITGKVSTGNQFYRIYMNGTNFYINKGFAFVAGSGGDGNNDVNTFFDVVIENYATAGWSFEHSQSKAHRFIACAFEAGAGQTNQYGVTTALGAGNQGGSFSWTGGAGGNNAEADFYLISPNDKVMIVDSNFEGSGRLLETGNSTSGFPITISGVRWAANGLNADGKAIIYGHLGPLVLIGNLIGDVGGKALQMIAQSAGGTSAVAIGNHIDSTLANPFTDPQGAGVGGWVTMGNNLNGYPTLPPPNTLMGNGGAAVTIANLPACTLPTLGQQAIVSNGQTTPPWNGPVSTTGAVYAPVGCSQTAASTYGWVYR